MRILHVIATAAPESGGPIEATLRCAEALHALGHEVEIVSLDPPGPESHVRPIIHRLGSGGGAWSRRWLPWRRYRYAPALTPWLRARAGEYDAVVINGLWNYASLGAWRALRNGRTPYFVFPHGMLDPWFNRAYPRKAAAKRLFWRTLEHRVLRDARAVLFTCEDERALAATAFQPYRCRERIAPLGVTGSSDDGQAQEALFRAATPGLAGRPYLLFLGRIHPKKGCDVLIEAFAAVAAGHPELDLVLAGPDESGWRRDLERLAVRLNVAHRVHWPGLLSGDLKWGAFRGATAFCLPSHQENFGLVVVEAMSCRTPVVITDKVNIWGEVEDAGGLISQDDAPSFAAALRTLLAMPTNERRKLGETLRAGFLDRFEARGAAAKLLSVLQEDEAR